MRHFINIKNISSTDLRKILNDAKKRKYKRKNYSSLEIDKGAPLKGKLLIQMFEKSSLRTRISFFLAIRQLGGSALTLRPDELHFSKEVKKYLIQQSNKRLCRRLRRTDNDSKLDEIYKHIKIPLINGLSPSSHPSQILSDIFTMKK